MEAVRYKWRDFSLVEGRKNLRFAVEAFDRQLLQGYDSLADHAFSRGCSLQHANLDLSFRSTTFDITAPTTEGISSLIICLLQIEPREMRLETAVVALLSVITYDLMCGHGSTFVPEADESLQKMLSSWAIVEL